MKNQPYKKCMCGADLKLRQRRCDACLTRTCLHCGQRFQLKGGKVDQACCSRKCAAMHDTQRIKRINEHRGIKPRTYSLKHRNKHGCIADREWRVKVFERDNYTCQICFRRGHKLQADHILPFSTHPHLRHKLSNGRTLCVDCHKLTPTYGYKARRFKRLSQEVFNFDTEASA